MNELIGSAMPDGNIAKSSSFTRAPALMSCAEQNEARL